MRGLSRFLDPGKLHLLASFRETRGHGKHKKLEVSFLLYWFQFINFDFETNLKGVFLPYVFLSEVTIL
jgi:hypothetical protein